MFSEYDIAPIMEQIREKQHILIENYPDEFGPHKWSFDLDEWMADVLKPYGLTPEEAAVQFFEYCADPKTQDHAITLLKRWKEEQEAQERNSTNAK